jgi:hypothetical protein
MVIVAEYPNAHQQPQLSESDWYVYHVICFRALLPGLFIDLTSLQGRWSTLHSAGAHQLLPGFLLYGVTCLQVPSCVWVGLKAVASGCTGLQHEATAQYS